MLKRLYIVFVVLGIAQVGWATNFLRAADDESASNQVVRVETNTASGVINKYARFYLEASAPLSLDDILEPQYQEKFAPVTTPEPDFGYYEKGIWLKIPVQNMSASEQERFLIMHTNFMPELAVYWATPDGIKTLLYQDRDSKFKSRPVPYHQLVAPLTLAGNEKGALYIRYTSQGNTVLPLSLETPLSFASTTNRRVITDFVFYGVMAMFIIASVAGRLFFTNATFVAYFFYASSVLLFIFQRDGYAFQYLWPNAPHWNNFSSLPIGCSLPAFAAIFTRFYLKAKMLHPVINKILIGTMLAQIPIVASSLLIGPSEAKKIAVLTTTVCILIFVSIGVAAYRKYGRRTLFFVIGWSGILCASLVMSIVHWANIDVTRAQSLDIMRVSMVFDALMMGLASVFSIVDLQKEREKLDQERISVLDTNLQLHNRLARLEQKYHLAQTLAETNNQLLVDTTHDLRQPLYALRAAMGEVLSMKAPDGRVAEIEQSLNYIEQLVGAALEKAIDDDESGRTALSDQPEVMDVSKLFSALEAMFEADARQQSVDVKIAPVRKKIDVVPFPVLRIMANFVSNAIRYADGGRVLIGARKHGDFLSLEVHDTGPGMSPEELAAVKRRYARGETVKDESDGQGVGLSIVATLAREHDFRWTIESEKGRGTVAKLFVPAMSGDRRHHPNGPTASLPLAN